VFIRVGSYWHECVYDDQRPNNSKRVFSESSTVGILLISVHCGKNKNMCRALVLLCVRPYFAEESKTAFYHGQRVKYFRLKKRSGK
jgi:hypothetical protein